MMMLGFFNVTDGQVMLRKTGSTFSVDRLEKEKQQRTVPKQRSFRSFRRVQGSASHSFVENIFPARVLVALLNIRAINEKALQIAFKILHESDDEEKRRRSCTRSADTAISVSKVCCLFRVRHLSSTFREAIRSSG